MIYKIPSNLISATVANIERLNGRLRKMGMPETTVKILSKGIEQVKVRNHAVDIEAGPDAYSLVAMEVTHIEVIRPESLSLNGWYFVATIVSTEAGNVFKALSTAYPIPEHYRNCDPVCDHCKTVRNRKDTYVVHNPETGDWKQVGKNCLKDFTGHKDPESLARAMEYYYSMEQTCSENENDGFGGGLRSEPVYSLLKILEASKQFIKENGFTSRSKARELGCTATAENVMAILVDPKSWNALKTLPELTQDDREQVQKAVEWAQNLEVGPEDDYLWNIHVVAQCTQIPIKFLGLAVSMIAAYDREMSKNLEKALESKMIDGYYGQPGQKIEVTGTLIKHINFDTTWGTSHILTFVVNGYCLIWMTNKPSGEVGKVYTIKATIKEHKEYKGIKQTAILRTKLTEKL